MTSSKDLDAELQSVTFPTLFSQQPSPPAKTEPPRGKHATLVVPSSLRTPQILQRAPGTSLVIPAHNEESRIGPTLEKYLPILESRGRPFEVIVVVDGSDRTSDVAERYGERGVRVTRARNKLGKGGAILAGFRETRHEVVGYVDADGSLSTEDFTKIIELISTKRADCVIASRWLAGSQWVRKESFQKRIASRGFNILTRGLLGLDIHDTQCGAKFYRGQLVDKLVRQVMVTNLTTDVGFLFHAHKNGATIMEIPVTWDDDPRSRFNLATMVPIMFLTVLGIKVMSLSISRILPDSAVVRFQRLLGSI